MNYDNLRKMAAIHDEMQWVFDLDGLRLYCDGHLICLAGEMPLVKSSNPKSGKWEGLAVATFRDSNIGEPVRDAGLFGDLCDYGYTRRFSGETANYIVQERYRRCFADDATFTALRVKTGQQLRIFEGEKIVGVLMTCDPKGMDSAPAVPYLADDVLYHVCPEHGGFEF